MIEIIKKMLVNPSEGFRDVAETPVEEDIKYFAVILAVYSILTGLLSFSLIKFVGVMIGAYTGGCSGVLLGSLILHLLVKLVGGKKTYKETLKVSIYSATPSFLFGWIPLIGWIGKVLTLELIIIGLAKLHNISKTRSTMAVLIIVAIGVIWVLALILSDFGLF